VAIFYFCFYISDTVKVSEVDNRPKSNQIFGSDVRLGFKFNNNSTQRISIFILMITRKRILIIKCIIKNYRVAVPLVSNW
jgi:hypothetical protein